MADEPRKRSEKAIMPGGSVAVASSDVAATGAAESPGLALPKRNAPPLLMSLILHAALLTLVGLAWTRTPRGTGVEADRPVGIAMVHRMPDRDRYVDSSERPTEEPETADPSDATSGADSETVADEPTDSEAAFAPPADMDSPIDLEGTLRSLSGTPSAAESSGLAGDAILGDDAFAGDSSRGAPAASDQATAMVFGVSGSGSRFAYVFDRSDSMNGFEGRPLRAAKAELIRSLETLSEKQEFQLIFYNDKPQAFRLPGAPLQLVRGDSSMIAAARRHVESISAFGGTEHDAALKMALRMSPDVIFFLTDARIPRLSGPQLGVIRDRARRAGTTIHAIEFGPESTPPSDSFLRDLAAQNGGQYQYVDVRELGQDSR